MKSHQLEHSHVRALEVLQSSATLIGQRTDDIAGEDEESRPRDHREQQVQIESCLDRGGSVQSDERLEEGNEDDDENRGPHCAAPAEIESGGNDGQVVEVEKSDLL